MRQYSIVEGAFEGRYTQGLRRQILACPYFSVNTLNRDFVATRGFSVIFRRDSVGRVDQQFPFFKPFLHRALRSDCNAFYLNPLLLTAGSRVDPHIDRSLQSFVTHVDPPACVSVLYVEVPEAMQGGALSLARGRNHLAKIVPRTNMLLTFDGDLTHSISRFEGEGSRLSLVCEQYALTDEELERIPELAIQSSAMRPRAQS